MKATWSGSSIRPGVAAVSAWSPTGLATGAAAIATSPALAPEASIPRRRVRGAFGSDRFGRTAEGFARFFGTPGFIIGQTMIVALWAPRCTDLPGTTASKRWSPMFEIFARRGCR